MNRNEYNGWTNYETWCVNLWMDNEEGAQRAVRGWAREALHEAFGDKEDATAALAENLRDAHEERVEALPENLGVLGDLLNSALSEVNWREIARSLLDSLDE